MDNNSNIKIMSDIPYRVYQTPTTANLVHYRNIFASPENFIKRKVDYSKMKVFDEKYRKELERINSFENNKFFNEEQVKMLAKSGFYYRENFSVQDQVKCIYCQGTISSWKKNDVPMKLHKFNFPTCPFMIHLNVGNESLININGKPPIEDPDVKKPCENVKVIIPKVKSNIWIDSFDKIDNLDIDFREETFAEYPSLRHFALKGFFFLDKISSKYVKCSWCFNEVNVLQGIEYLGDNLMHKSHCKFNNIEYFLNKKIEEAQRSNEDFCDVEFSLVNEEIEARMETRLISQLLNEGYDRQKLRTTIEHQLKKNGKDFESLFELILEFSLELKKEIKHDAGKRKSVGQELALTEYPCVVCLDKPVEVVFLPCGHLKTCLVCSDLMLNCPVCRVRIEKRVKKFKFRR